MMAHGKVIGKNIKKKNIFFASLKAMKKLVGSGSISQVRIRGSGSGSAPKWHGSPTLPRAFPGNPA
jgi:hypothetical protein